MHGISDLTRPAVVKLERLLCFEVGGYEVRRRLSIDGVSVGAQASHSAGSPMSQRECAGFNWPPLSIPAEEPVRVCPQAVNRTEPHILAVPWFDGLGLSFLPWSYW